MSYIRKREDIRRMRKISAAQRGRYCCSGCWYDQKSGRYRQVLETEKIFLLQKALQQKSAA